MTTENILLIMLFYILGCVVVYYLVSKYYIDRKSIGTKDQNNGKSLIDDLEIERNIFEIPSEDDGIDRYEIDSPYAKKSIDDLIGNSKDKVAKSGIGKKIRRLLE